MKRTLPMVLISIANIATAEGTVEAQTNAYLDMFYSVCMSRDFTVAGMQQIATSEGWQKLPPLLIMSSRPQGDVVAHGGWTATLPEFIDLPVHIYASRAKDPGGVYVDTCSIYMRTFLQSEAVAHFEAALADRRVSDDRQGGARWLMYLAPDTVDHVISVRHEGPQSQGRGVELASTFIRPIDGSQ